MQKLMIALLSACAFPAMAADVLIDNYNAEKARIASQYQAAISACSKQAPANVDVCRRAAQVDRRQALHAASQERDTGLKCRTSCGLVTNVTKDAAAGHKATWHVAYDLYSGDHGTADFNQDPQMSNGTKISIQNGKPIKR